jgi:pimeloyl-ACP methyl ester carboxylesterase
MQTLHVNGPDMAYLEVGQGPPLVCVHGALGDFRTWSPVLGPLSKQHRVIAVSLSHFFPSTGTASATPTRGLIPSYIAGNIVKGIHDENALENYSCPRAQPRLRIVRARRGR